MSNLQNLFTLRYDPTVRGIERKYPRDFVQIHSDPEGKHVEEMLRDIIHLRLRPHKNICISLSSGVDSTLLLALIRDIFPTKRITALTMSGIKSEEEIAAKVAAYFDANHVILNFPDIVKEIPLMVKVAGEARWNVYPYYTRLMSKKYGSIIVNGDGADEIFGGYVFRYKQFDSLVNQGFTKVQSYLRAQKNDWVDDQAKFFKHRFTWKSIERMLEPYFNNYLENTNQIMLADYNGKFLYDYSRTNASIDRYFNVDSFYPFCDPALTKYALHLPVEEKWNGKLGKIHLRNISKRIGLKQHTKKLGFVLDTKKMYLKNKDEIKKVLLNPRNKIYNTINYKWILKHIDTQDPREINKMFQALALSVLKDTKV